MLLVVVVEKDQLVNSLDTQHKQAINFINFGMMTPQHQLQLVYYQLLDLMLD